MRHAAPHTFSVAVCAVVATAVLAAPGGAHFQTYPYTLSSCPAGYERQVDPVNVVFYGNATSSLTLDHLGHHLGWWDAGGSTQSFSSEGVCGEMDGQRASASTFQSRFHVRVKQTLHGDATWGITARGDAHHEDLVWYCGHAVDKGGGSTGLSSGFDQGRRATREGLAGAHTYGGATYWGNTRQFKQCDGDYAGSDGYVDWWRIPPWSH